MTKRKTSYKPLIQFGTDESVCSIHRWSEFDGRTWGSRDGVTTLTDFVKALIQPIWEDINYDGGGFEPDTEDWNSMELTSVFQVLDHRKSSFMMAVTNGVQTDANKYLQQLVDEHGWTSIVTKRPKKDGGDLTIWLTTLGEFEALCVSLFPTPKPKAVVNQFKVVIKGSTVKSLRG